MAGAGDIMAGRAFVEVATKDKTGEGLSKIAGNFKKFGAGIVSIGSAIGAGVAALAGSAFAGAVASLAKFAESGSALKDMADRTGLSVENLSELGFAANQTGTDLETVEGAARKMAQTIAKAGAGGKQAVKALADLGLTAQELAGLSPDEQLDKIGKAIAGISNPTTKAAAAMAVFGKSGTKLIPLLGDMAALRSEAERLGLVMSQEDAEAADALGDAWDTVTAQTGSLANQIGAALAPAVTSVLEVVQNLIADAIGWVNANRSIMDSVTDLITLFPTFESAAAVAYLGIQVAALEIVTPILESFAILRSATLSIFDAISAGVKTIWAELMGFIAKGAIDMQVLLGKIPEAIGEQAKMLIDVGVETKKEDIADELAYAVSYKRGLFNGEQKPRKPMAWAMKAGTAQGPIA